MFEIEIGKSYICKPIGAKKEVVGYIEHTYANTVLICVEEYDEKDRSTIIEKQHRMLVKYEDILSQIELVS
ncbi:hypothetical protein D920_00769 [Enterococcus faecalis 13-SD-W-01]|nr:hypothetical protein D920_00769 [Enterococcus faecalis 13-SD-W-01]